MPTTLARQQMLGDCPKCPMSGPTGAWPGAEPVQTGIGYALDNENRLPEHKAGIGRPGELRCEGSGTKAINVRPERPRPAGYYAA